MARRLQAEIQQSRSFASLEEEMLLNLERTADCFRRQMQQALKPSGITMTQYNVLRILRGAGPAGLACSVLRERLVSSDPDITRLLERLARQGLLKRRRDARDRRVVLTVISEGGLRMLEQLVPLVDAQVRTAVPHLSGDQVAALIDLLEQARAPYTQDIQRLDPQGNECGARKFSAQSSE